MNVLDTVNAIAYEAFLADYQDAYRKALELEK